MAAAIIIFSKKVVEYSMGRTSVLRIKALEKPASTIVADMLTKTKETPTMPKISGVS